MPYSRAVTQLRTDLLHRLTSGGGRRPTPQVDPS